jgi:hypothetical protein
MVQSIPHKEKDPQNPIHISQNDFQRAYKKVKAFQKLLDRGKTPVQMMQDMIKMIEINHDDN